MKKAKTLIFLVANDRYFYTHRLELALKAQEEGYQVLVACPLLGWHQKIEERGIPCHNIPFDRGGLNPFREIKTLWAIYKLYKKERPQIVHHVALKPALWGTLVARCLNIPQIFNAVSGLGHLYSGAPTLLKKLFLFLARALWKTKNVTTIVQNPEDEEEIKSLLGPIAPVIRQNGAGVNLRAFSYSHPPASPPFIFTLASRMIEPKGIKEFVEALTILHERGHPIKGWLVGEPDLENKTFIPLEKLRDYSTLSYIEYMGFQEDMPHLYAQTHVAVLPTYYREGIPKTLIEAAACGKPIITTPMPGCTLVVEPEINGYLTPIQDAQALAENMEKFILNPSLLSTMGAQSRQRAENMFDAKMIVQEIISLYDGNHLDSKPTQKV